MFVTNNYIPKVCKLKQVYHMEHVLAVLGVLTHPFNIFSALLEHYTTTHGQFDLSLFSLVYKLFLNNQRTNGPVNAHLRPGIYTNKLA